MIAAVDQPPLYAEIASMDRDDSAIQDLHFIHQTILENHPGPFNTLDPDFMRQMEENYLAAQQKLDRAQSDEERAEILSEFGKSFNDSHLSVWIDSDTSEWATKGEKGPFGIQELGEGMRWITIPTFNPKENEIKELEHIIQTLPQFRDEIVIFDLRGNGGGSSAWGVDLLNALFGKEYADLRLEEMMRTEYIEWRVSPRNFEYLKELVPSMKTKFGPSHFVIRFIEKIVDGMGKALETGDPFFKELRDEHPPLPHAENLARKKVIAIVDRRCGSACLDFLDGLKAMKSDLVLIGETTGADSLYMELRKVPLPSRKGQFAFPMKVYRDRPRGHNVPYTPDVPYNGNLQDTAQLQDVVKDLLQKSDR